MPNEKCYEEALKYKTTSKNCINIVEQDLDTIKKVLQDGHLVIFGI